MDGFQKNPFNQSIETYNRIIAAMEIRDFTKAELGISHHITDISPTSYLMHGQNMFFAFVWGYGHGHGPYLRFNSGYDHSKSTGAI